jgi:hypothetical protein
MANLIAGKQVVPELIQSEFTAENIVSALEPLLPDNPPRQSMMAEPALGLAVFACGRGPLAAYSTLTGASLRPIGFTGAGKIMMVFGLEEIAFAEELPL